MAKKKTHKKILLTDPKIKELKPSSKGKRKYRYDTRVDGLRVMVTPAGSKSFQYSCWVPGHGPFTYTIGKCSRVTVAIARKKAAIINGDIALHGSDAVEKIKGNRDELTLDQAFALYLKDQVKRGTRDIATAQSRWDSHISPTIGSKRVTALTPKMVEAWHLKLTSRRKAKGKGTLSRTTCNRCLELVRAMYNAKLPSIPNPAAKIKKFTESSRERYLSGAELGRLFVALEDAPIQFKDIIMMALLTGARKANLLSMAWADINLDIGIWIIPAENSKNGKSISVPLIPEAIEILERRSQNLSRFVFPGPRNGHSPHIQHQWGKLLKEANIEDFHIHDLRRTFGSYQALVGSSDLIIGKSLGHKGLG